MAASSGLDPRILAIMAKLNGTEQQCQEEETKSLVEVVPPPPRTVEEFLQAEQMDEWPYRITSESLDLSDERASFPTQEELLEELKRATPFTMQHLQNLENRLRELQGRINVYADQLLVPNNPQDTIRSLNEATIHKKEMHNPFTEATGPRGDEVIIARHKPINALDEPINCVATATDQPTIIAVEPAEEDDGAAEIPEQKVFITETSEFQAVRKYIQSKQSEDLKQKMLESKRRTVEKCIFPGFKKGELTELPHNLEAPQILNRVTRAHNFNPGFGRFWRKAFQSEASVAVMQDAFWWTFLESFQPDEQQSDADALFDRIADSFVALFTSVHPEIRDKFLNIYPDALAQALYAAYTEAFPQSLNHFNDEFKQKLIYTVFEWISGIHPAPGSYERWDTDRLKPDLLLRARGERGIVRALIDSGLNHQVKYSLDMEGFHAIVNDLGKEPMVSSPRPGSAPEPRGPAFWNTPRSSDNAESSQRHGKGDQESSTVGRGPEFERVLFNLDSVSPLVAHYLHMRELRRRDGHVGRKVMRTEITSHKPSGPTYRQVIKESRLKARAMGREYQSICDATANEIARIEKRQRRINRDISRLQRELMTSSCPCDVKTMAAYVQENALES